MSYAVVLRSLTVQCIFTGVILCDDTKVHSNISETIDLNAKRLSGGCLKHGEVVTVNAGVNSSITSRNVTNIASDEKKGNDARILTSGEIHRQRIIVSGYLIFGVVFLGLLFLGVTHYLGRREVRKYRLRHGLTYLPASSNNAHRV